MITTFGIIVGLILFLIFERKRLQRLFARSRTRADADVRPGGHPRLSARAQALAEFLEIVLADAGTAVQAAWTKAALEDNPAEGDATNAFLTLYFGSPHATQPHVLLGLNTNSAVLLRSMAQELAAGHAINDAFEWDCNAPTDNTVIDGIMAFEHWLAPHGYTLLYFESGYDMPTTFALRTGNVARVLVCAERAGLTVLRGPAYRTSEAGLKVLAAAARLRRDPAQNAMLEANLTAAGFFAGLPDTRTRELATLVRRIGYRGLFDHDWRAFEADDEELADGQVGGLLSRCATAFMHLKIPPMLAQSRFADGGTHFLDWTPGNGSAVLLSAADGFPHAQYLVAARLLVQMNHYLASFGLEERFYSVYSGNDAEILLLSPAMLAVINSIPFLTDEERPHSRRDSPEVLAPVR